MFSWIVITPLRGQWGIELGKNESVNSGWSISKIAFPNSKNRPFLVRTKFILFQKRFSCFQSRLTKPEFTCPFSPSVGQSVSFRKAEKKIIADFLWVLVWLLCWIYWFITVGWIHKGGVWFYLSEKTKEALSTYCCSLTAAIDNYRGILIEKRLCSDQDTLEWIFQINKSHVFKSNFMVVL